MATTAEFRNGLCIEYQGAPHIIISFQHVKPGKGGAFVRTRLKNLVNGKIIDHTFNAGVKITVARVEHRPFQYQYQDEAGLHLMDVETFMEEVIIPPAIVEAPQLLNPGQEVTLALHVDTGNFLSCELPPFVWLTVEYTEPGFAGNTATQALKPARLETGAELQVPLFINIGDEIKIDTRTLAYVERKKNKK